MIAVILINPNLRSVPSFTDHHPLKALPQPDPGARAVLKRLVDYPMANSKRCLMAEITLHRVKRAMENEYKCMEGWKSMS
jgi:hypothetical protein